MQTRPAPRILSASVVLAVLYLAAIGVLVILERVGAPARFVSGILMVLGAAAVFAYGVSGATTQSQKFFGLEGPGWRGVSAAAIAVMVPGAGFLIALPGLSLVPASLVWPLVAGMACGLLASAAWIAPKMATCPSSTIAAMILQQTRSRALSFIAFVISAATALVLLIVHTGIASLLLAGILGTSLAPAVLLCLVLAAIPSLMGGMNAGIRVQVLAYGFIVVALAVIFTVLLAEIGLPVLSVSLPSDFVQPHIGAAESPLGRLQLPEWPIAMMSGPAGAVAAFLGAFAVVVTLPHVTGKQAGVHALSRGWTMLRLALLFVLPLAGMAALGPVVALFADRTLAGLPVSALPDTAPWMVERLFTLTGAPVTVCSAPAATAEAIVAACGSPAYEVLATDIRIDASLAGLVPAFLQGLPAAATPAYLMALAITAMAGMCALFNSLASLVADEAVQPADRFAQRPVAVGRATVIASAAIAAAGVLRGDWLVLSAIWVPGVAASTLFWPVIAFATGKQLQRRTIAATMATGFAVPLGLAGMAVWNGTGAPQSGPFTVWLAGLPTVSIIALGLAASGLIMVMMMGLEQAPDDNGATEGETTGHESGAGKATGH